MHRDASSTQAGPGRGLHARRRVHRARARQRRRRGECLPGLVTVEDSKHYGRH
ncbi:MAG: hypothetical protein M0C28_06420 [Candidatus Moduliflexus flocculans]|nr:hypothetical protein [Candidatus Moduliflexus flocculans]